MKPRFTTSSDQNAPATQAVRRAARLLKALGETSVGLGLTQLADLAALNKATVFRILGALELEELVVRDAARETYTLGPALVALGTQARRATGLHDAAHPVLAALAHDTGETVTLEVLVGDEVLILDEIQGRHRVGVRSEIGTRWPAHLTSTGKALLAGDAAHAGHATTYDEVEAGFAAVGAPVRNAEDRVVAAISVGGPTVRLTRERLHELAPTVRAAADRISQRLGASPREPRPAPSLHSPA